MRFSSRIRRLICNPMHSPHTLKMRWQLLIKSTQVC